MKLSPTLKHAACAFLAMGLLIAVSFVLPRWGDKRREAGQPMAPPTDDATAASATKPPGGMRGHPAGGPDDSGFRDLRWAEEPVSSEKAEATVRSLLTSAPIQAWNKGCMEEAIRVAGFFRDMQADRGLSVLVGSGVPWYEAPDDVLDHQRRRGLSHDAHYHPAVWALVRLGSGAAYVTGALIQRADVATHEGKEQVFHGQCVLLGILGLEDAKYYLEKIASELQGVNRPRALRSVMHALATLDAPHPSSGSRWEKCYALDLYDRYYVNGLP